MSRWNPCKRLDFIRRLRGLGFQGPFSGGKHEFMVWQQQRLAIPTNAEFSVPQLRLLLREVSAIIGRSISETEWRNLG